MKNIPPPGILGSAGAVVVFILWYLVPGLLTIPPLVSTQDRLALAAGSLVPTAIVLFCMLTAQMVGRGVSGALDPTAGKDGQFLVRNQRAITNTIEHGMVFVIAITALMVRAPAGWLPNVVAIALVFALARFAFWIGYVTNPMLRSPGMAMTYGSNLVTAIAAAVVWLK